MQEYIFQPKKIYYRKNDFRPDCPTLVFIHGISGSSSAWLLYEKKFKDQYNILTFDLRGHGNSWKPKNLEDYEIKKFAEDFFELVSFLKIKKFILISHSFGSLVVFAFLERHINMVEKIVFLSASFAPNQVLRAKIVKPFLNLAYLLKFFPFDQSGKGHVDYKDYINTGDWNMRRMKADIGITSLRVYLYGLNQGYKVNYESLLDKINIPTLIIHGKKDTIFPVCVSVEMHEKISDSRLIIVENMNHMSVLNNFLEVSEAIANF